MLFRAIFVSNYCRNVEFLIFVRKVIRARSAKMAGKKNGSRLAARNSRNTQSFIVVSNTLWIKKTIYPTIFSKIDDTRVTFRKRTYATGWSFSMNIYNKMKFPTQWDAQLNRQTLHTKPKSMTIEFFFLSTLALSAIQKILIVFYR
jgi:hypothetical protein